MPTTEKINYTGIVIAVDFDGTCVTHKFPDTGEDIGAAPVLRRLVKAGAKLILWTMRSAEGLDTAVEWFAKNKIPLFGINENPLQKSWTSSPKAYAMIYIDDAALGCPLVHPDAPARPHVDWPAVEALLFPKSKSNK